MDSDHSPIQLDLSFGSKIQSKSIKIISKRNYNKANWKQFYKNLNLINNNKYNDLNLIEYYESFKLDINNEIDKNIPMCSYNNDGSKNKLLPQHIIDMIKTKNKCGSNYKRYGNQIDQNNMYYMKEKIKEEIIINKQVEMKNFLDKLKKLQLALNHFGH